MKKTLLSLAVLVMSASIAPSPTFATDLFTGGSVGGQLNDFLGEFYALAFVKPNKTYFVSYGRSSCAVIDEDMDIVANFSKASGERFIPAGCVNDEMEGVKTVGIEINFIATQEFFNHTSDFEYFVKGKDYLRLKNSDGETLFTFNLPGDERNYVSSLTLYRTSSGKKFISFCYSNYDNEVFYLYQVNTGANGSESLLTLKREERRVMAYPNPVSRGEEVTIEVPGEGTAQVMITSVNGEMVYAGSAMGNTRISTSAFASGVYVYNVVKDSKVVNSGKIVVK